MFRCNPKSFVLSEFTSYYFTFSPRIRYCLETSVMFSHSLLTLRESSFHWFLSNDLVPQAHWMLVSVNKAFLLSQQTPQGCPEWWYIIWLWRVSKSSLQLTLPEQLLIVQSKGSLQKEGDKEIIWDLLKQTDTTIYSNYVVSLPECSQPWVEIIQFLAELTDYLSTIHSLTDKISLKRDF